MKWMGPDLNHRELGLTDPQVLDMYRLMLEARRVDDRMFALNRQGRAPFVVGSSGHEAVQVASAFALDHDQDWVLPYYRDMGVALAWGLSLLDIFLAVFARATDRFSGGRQLPNHWSDRERRVFTQSSCIGTQYPHAAGIAKALQIQGESGVVAVYGGEGSTSEGDWHEAVNFAAIHKLPVLFITENNRYAISVPSTHEVAGTISGRAVGYGIKGYLIDGNDALVVYQAVKDAADRARRGDGTEPDRGRDLSLLRPHLR